MRLIKDFLNSNKALPILLAFHFLVWFSIALILNVHPDMADHWMWSRYLDFGYYEHPPMVALTMKLATLIGGDHALTLKIGSVLYSVLVLYLCYLVGKEFFDKKVSLIYLLILEVTGYFSVGSVFWHIDQPYMMFWLLAFWGVGKYLNSGNINWIFYLGVILGLGAQSKYIMVFFPISLLIWCVIRKRQRVLLTSWKSYVSGIITLLILLPNLYWNYQNEWATFTYNFKKGMTGATFGKEFLLFMIGQFILFSIVYSLYFWKSLFTKEINSSQISISKEVSADARSFLYVLGTVPFLFFMFSSFAGQGADPHWVNVSYFSYFLLFAKFLHLQVQDGKLKQHVIVYSIAFVWNIFLIGCLLLQTHFNTFNMAFEGSPLQKLVGWKQTAKQIKALTIKSGKELPDFVITREYQLGGVLGLYLENQPMSHSIEKPIRNKWSPVAEVLEKGAILVCPIRECKSTVRDAEERFKKKLVDFGKFHTIHNGFEIRGMKVYYLPPEK